MELFMFKITVVFQITCIMIFGLLFDPMFPLILRHPECKVLDPIKLM